jgi:predicted enzyme related to lactoylglutathione lyase
MHKSRLGCLVIDCETDDLDREAEFWSKAFGNEIIRRYESGDEKYRGLATDETQPRILLQKVSHKSRVHLDIETDDVEMEVNRLKNLGAKEIERVRNWCVMEAPSGHRFCVVKHQHRGFEEKATVWEQN